MKNSLKRGICAACLPVCLGVIWLWAERGSSTESGVSALDMVSGEDAMQGEEPETDGFGNELEERILQIFTEQGNAAVVEKVSWGQEELVSRLWEQMEQWQETHNNLRMYTGYIEMLGEASGETEEGFLREYATVQYRQFQDTFLVTDQGIYKIKSWGEHDSWRECMEELLWSVPQWQIAPEEAGLYVHELDLEGSWQDGEEASCDNRLQLWHQGTAFSFRGEQHRLLEYGTDVECLAFSQTDQGEEQEWRICAVPSPPACDTGRELREYLQALHPNLKKCWFYSPKEEQDAAEQLLVLETDEAEYGYYCQRGQWYRVCVRTEEGTGSRNIEDSGIALKYGTEYIYRFEVTDEGEVSEGDWAENHYFFQRVIGPGQVFLFDCRETDRENFSYEVAVSVPGAERPFQTIETFSACVLQPFSFDDFNADGYLDLLVTDSYGNGPGTFYLWSPTEEKYVKCPEEMDHCRPYDIDRKERRISLHESSADIGPVSGTELRYQWSGERDCELIRRFSHDIVYDSEYGENSVGVQVDIRSYENGQEKILSEYLCSEAEYQSRNSTVWKIFELDFVWEQEITLAGQERPYILRYAQTRAEINPGDEERNNSYADYIFLFREDTCLFCALEACAAPAAYTDLGWEDEKQRLKVGYEDGTVQYYWWNGVELCGEEPQPEEFERALKEKMEQIFTEQGCVAEVEKVSWGQEELAGCLWEQMEQWQEAYKKTPRIYSGYIELLGDPAGETGEGFLREYGTAQYDNFQDTFLVTDLGIYEIKSRGEHTSWLEGMERLLWSVPRWQITPAEAKGYVHELDFEKWKRYYSEPPYANRMNIWYRGIMFSFYGEQQRLLAYEAGAGSVSGEECVSAEPVPGGGEDVSAESVPGGREDVSAESVPGREEDAEFVSGWECLQFRQMDQGGEQEWRLCTVQALPAFDTYKELREYLQVLHPDLRECRFYSREANQYSTDVLIDLETDEAEYGYFCREGQWYQVCIRSEGKIGGEIHSLNISLEYSMYHCYHYLVTDQGEISENDVTQERYYFQKENSPGQVFAFDCRMKEENSSYRIAVSALGERKPFQILETRDVAAWDPFSFDDYNADGYRDLQIECADGVMCYLWSPTKKKYVPCPSELDKCDFYDIDPEKRQISIHRYDSAPVSGTELLYQWSGETDCELIRRFVHEEVYEHGQEDNTGMQVDISCFENGREKVLSSWLYPVDEYNSRRELWGIYRLDFVWEREVTLAGQENSCILRYAQEKEEPDGDGQEKGYRDCIYLFREDTYLLCALEKQAVAAAWADIVWEEELQQLSVYYEDGTAYRYRWNGAEFGGI